EKLHPGGVDLDDDRITEAVDDGARQAVRLGMDEAIVGRLEQLVSQGQRAGEARGEEVAVNGHCGIAAEESCSDERARAEHGRSHRAAVVADDADQGAGGQRLGRGVHDHFVRGDPGGTRQDPLVLARLQHNRPPHRCRRRSGNTAVIHGRRPYDVQSPTATPSRRLSAPPTRPSGVSRMAPRPLFMSSTLTSWPMARSAGARVSSAVPCSSSVAPLRLAKFGRSTAACGSRCQSRTAISVLATNGMICGPPGEPATSSSRPLASNTMVGAMELRGRLPGPTRLATGCPSRSGWKAKSVSSLLSRKPSTICRDPNALSMLVVKLRASPSASTMLM